MLSILSQDKGTLTRYNSVAINYGIDSKWGIETKDFILGQYETRERCEEIVQEVANAIYNTIINEGGIPYQISRVYKMPKE